MSTSPDDFLLVGRSTSAFGIHGKLRVRSYTDRPDHLAQHITTVYLGADYTPYRMIGLAEHKPGLLIMTLENVTTRDEAESLVRHDIFIRESEAAPLGEGEYFLHQLHGLRVETTDGTVLGQVHTVLETGANDVLVVQRPDQPDLLIPVIRSVVQQIDVPGGRLVIEVMEGLL